MSEPTNETEQTLGIDLEDADELMFDQLTEQFGEELVLADVREVVKERVRQLYDSRDQVAQQLQQAEQQAALVGQ